jgi:exo-beta-1,3-glucanase (GH17 family)
LVVSEAQIRADLTPIAKQANAVSTYASTNGLERVPEIAAELGLTVTLGIWIDKNEARNEHEIATALDLVRRHVTRMVE